MSQLLARSSPAGPKRFSFILGCRRAVEARRGFSHAVEGGREATDQRLPEPSSPGLEFGHFAHGVVFPEAWDYGDAGGPDFNPTSAKALHNASSSQT